MIRALGFSWLAYVVWTIFLIYLLRLWRETDPPPADAAVVLSIFLGSRLIDVLLGVIATIGLLNFLWWGRVSTILAAIIAMVDFPVGTAIGIWSLVALTPPKNSAAYRFLGNSSR
jgi:hypothetical protein